MELALFVIMSCVIVYLTCLNYVQLREFRKERQMLIDKIMSRNYTDYASGYSYANQPQLDQSGNGLTASDMIDELVRKSGAEEGIPVGS